ncbi:hypothetical protein Hdeb2414_s0001g00041391 [Helianthus debilis subsp. tardiflorus]
MIPCNCNHRKCEPGSTPLILVIMKTMGTYIMLQNGRRNKQTCSLLTHVFLGRVKS